jgi:purine-nucleoside phosphorylase
VADTYLTDVVQINGVRNMFGYTGNYKGKKVTVMGSGMGMPSIGIYSYELFAFYGVENIIRIGSCGSYTKDANVYDVIIVKDAYSESSFAKTAYGYEPETMDATEELVKDLNDAAKLLNYPVINGRIHSSDVFYRGVGDAIQSAGVEKNCLGVEMESFALFANAKFLNKKAACILTVSDSLITHEVTSSEERQNSFNKMMEIALEAAIK